MKLWNSDEELDAMIAAAAQELDEDDDIDFEQLHPEGMEDETPTLRVIGSDNAGQRINWKEHIEKVKAEYEQELERKKKLSDETGNHGLFTPEDIEYMMEENESFNGKKVNFSQVQKYNRLAAAAKALDARHMDILMVDCPPLKGTRASCIHVDINRLSIFANEDVKNTLAGMIAMCDNITISSVKEDNATHLSFMVCDLMTK